MPERRLTKGQRRALRAAVFTVIAGMVMGFWSSYTTLYAAAVGHRWATPAFLPLSVDTGIVAYVILDHLAIILGARSRLLHLIALALAAFTVWANAAVSVSGGATWRVIHAAMPALWVLGVEALRFMWRQLHAAPPPDRIPQGRWLAEPWTAFLLWRRMMLLSVASWQKMAAMEDTRLHLRDRVRAALDTDSGLTVPGEVRRVIRSGRLPAAVLAAVDLDVEYGGSTRAEGAADSWLDARLTLRDRVRADLDAARLEITRAAPGTGPEVSAPPTLPAPAGQASGQAPVTRQVTPRAPARRKAPATPRIIPDAELKNLVRAEFDVNPGVSVNAVARTLRRSRDRVRPLLDEVRREAVVPLAAVSPGAGLTAAATSGTGAATRARTRTARTPQAAVARGLIRSRDARGS